MIKMWTVRWAGLLCVIAGMGLLVHCAVRGKRLITMITCHPRNSDAQRLVVSAVLDSVATPPWA